jgi:hypothetical protein
MASFLHLTDDKLAARLVRLGIRPQKTSIKGTKGVYCTPVSRDHFRSHQWIRELKRTGVKSIHCIQFKVPDSTWVYIGRYNQEHLRMTASESVQTFNMHSEGLGLEIIIPCRIEAKWITHSYIPAQLIGWRYYPEAKGKKPFCHCRYCNRGQIRASRIIRDEE